MNLSKTTHIFEILQNNDTDFSNKGDDKSNTTEEKSDSDNIDPKNNNLNIIPSNQIYDTEEENVSESRSKSISKSISKSSLKCGSKSISKSSSKCGSKSISKSISDSGSDSGSESGSDNESSDNSIQTFKDTIYCINCGMNGHLYKKCSEPITSYGVILISLNISDDLKKRFIDSINSCNNFIRDGDGININDSIIDIGLFSYVKGCISFLMIQRKHTLGFIEFVRGRYSIDNIDDISYLFKQMTSEEIERIKNESFDTLWNNLWGKTRNKSIFKKEYINSNKKFNKLKYHQGGFLNLDYYVDKIKPTWDYAEWGFPKGRRNYLEDDIECSIREFKEETGLLDNDFTIFNNIKPTIELFIGTNGVPYKHIYYTGIINTDKPMFVDQSNPLQYQEIGNIKFMNYEECMSIIRPYHIEKKRILSNLYMAIINTLVNIIKKEITST